MRCREPRPLPRSVHPVRRGAVALGGTVLAVTLLSACTSFGLAGHASSGTTTPAASASAGPETPAETAAETAPAVVTENPTSAPTPLPVGAPVATDTPPSRRTDVVLSFAGFDKATASVEAGGYLSPVVESGGTCTLALTQGSRTVTAEAPARADASTTSCGGLAVPRAHLAPGTWTAVLLYASKTTTGKSDPMPVAVPQ